MFDRSTPGYDQFEPRVLERVDSDRGEVVLRQAGEHFEIISNGTFLMDTRDGRSERALAELGIAAAAQPRSILIGGLGVGFTLAAAASAPAVESVLVVEAEDCICRWYDKHFRHLHDLAGSRATVEISQDDLVEFIQRGQSSFDVICLDIDNGPDWTVHQHNDSVYTDACTEQLWTALNPGGALAVWSAHRSADYEATLARRFGNVEVHPIAVNAREPDVVYLARRGG